MTFIHSEEERMLKDSALQFVRSECPMAHFRSLRYKNSSFGFSQELWEKICKLGWAAIPYPEEFGGLDMGFSSLALIFEQFGRNLTFSPLLSNNVMGGQTILRYGNNTQRERWLPCIVSGENFISLAYHEEQSRHDRLYSKTIASKEGSAFRINGAKSLVLDAPNAHAFLVSAKSHSDKPNGNLSLFLVKKNTPGVICEKQILMDGRVAGKVSFSDVIVESEQLVGEYGNAAPILAEIIDLATASLSAEMLGGMKTAFELAVEYLDQREQFGVKIGTFQALQHRASRMYIAIQMAESAVRAANIAIDDIKCDSKKTAKAISLAKALCSDSYLSIASEALQIFGGIGMTDEHDIGLYLKHARVNEQLFGDASWHRSRWATLSGY